MNQIPPNVSNNEQYKQSIHTASTVTQNMPNQQEAPIWVTTILKSLDYRLQGIETQLSQQNSRWQQIDLQLQNQNAQSQNQNSRMTQIEQKVEQINDIRQTVSNVEMQISDMDKEVENVNAKINTYSDSIGYFNEVFEGIVSQNESAKPTIDDLTKRI